MTLISQDGLPVVRLDVDEQLDGIPVRSPELGVDGREQATGERSPAPPQVVRELFEARHLFGDLDTRCRNGLDGNGQSLLPSVDATRENTASRSDTTRQGAKVPPRDEGPLEVLDTTGESAHTSPSE